MSKPETNFIARIHRKLKDVYKQGMGLTSTNGTPDYYYERYDCVLWVEYKWYPKKPDIVDLCDTTKKPYLSKLQQRWLRRASDNLVNVAVVAGYPGGCFAFFETSWMHVYVDPTTFIYTEKQWVDFLNELGE